MNRNTTISKWLNRNRNKITRFILSRQFRACLIFLFSHTLYLLVLILIITEVSRGMSGVERTIVVNLEIEQ